MSLRATGLVLLVLALSVTAGIAGADIKTDLVGHWPLDGDGLDISGNGLHGTVSGDVIPIEDRAGNPNSAMLFSGASDAYVDVGDPPQLQFTGAMTLAAWVVLDSENANNGRIVSKQAGGSNRSWSLNVEASANNVANPGTLHVASNSSTIVALNDTDPLPTDEWVHLAGVYKPGEAMELYVNGQLKVSLTAGVPASQFSDNSNTVLIGSRNACSNCGWMGAIDEVRIYSRALTAGDVKEVFRGDAARASSPSPTSGAADVPRDTVLGWAPGDFANTHDVYLGTVFEDVNEADRANPMDVLVSQGQADTTYEPPTVLDFGQTYYWRVDEVNAPPDSTIFKGEVWDFTVEPVAYPIANVVATSNGTSDAGKGPDNTVNGSGLNADDEHTTDADDMWLASAGADPLWIQFEFDRLYKLHELLVWNYNITFEPVLGFGIKNVTVEYSTDGADWTALGDFELAQATAAEGYAANTTIDLAGIAARYVRLTVNSGFGVLPQFGLSEVRFLQIPTTAREPQPADGATQVDPDAVLSWRAGREAVTHDVYLSTAPDAPALVGTVSDKVYAPGDLTFGTTYYWRIDEVNEAEVPSVWASDLWNFATREFVVIDDFESYNDDDNTIFDTWLDGFVNETGSTVGYFEAPFAEQTIVHGGRQSMPLEYVNDTAPFYSEAEFDLGNIDLDTNGADTLRLFVAGQAPAFVETADGTILMNGIGVDIWNAADEFRYVYKTLNGDGSMVVRVDSLVDSDVWAKGGVMIRETTDAGSAFAAVYMTGNNGVRYQARLTTDASAVSDSSVATAEQIALREPAWVKIERVGNAFNGYYSTDGEDWTDMAWNPQTINMAASVTIGLALTSHNATVATGAAFAGVAETGGVSGNWQVAEIGVTQPTTGNDIEPLYVALEDTSGNVAVVTHPNPAAVGIAAWQEWLIPYSDLAGINLNRMATMYIGVGDRDNPTAGGAGLIFVDDVSYGRAAPAVE